MFQTSHPATNGCFLGVSGRLSRSSEDRDSARNPELAMVAALQSARHSQVVPD